MEPQPASILSLGRPPFSTLLQAWPHCYVMLASRPATSPVLAAPGKLPLSTPAPGLSLEEALCASVKELGGSSLKRE